MGRVCSCVWELSPGPSWTGHIQQSLYPRFPLLNTRHPRTETSIPPWAPDCLLGDVGQGERSRTQSLGGLSPTY